MAAHSLQSMLLIKSYTTCTEKCPLALRFIFSCGLHFINTNFVNNKFQELILINFPIRMYRYSAIIPVMVMFLTQSFSQQINQGNKYNGAAPSLAADDTKVYLVYASGDTILFSSSNNKGKNFSAPVLAVVLPQLSTGGGRGPQIAITKDKLIIAAADKTGNIYSFVKNKNEEQWGKGRRINDVSGVAKEAFVSLASNDNGELYAVWLDLRINKKNKIVGAKSFDGGKTWSKNKVIYTSPDGSVCECCKPSVEMKDKMVVIMFRNWLKGNRDLFITTSRDGGLT